jgi:hypothetical protein
MTAAAFVAVALIAYLAGRAERIKAQAEVDALIRRSIREIGRVVADHLNQHKEPTK